MRWASAAGATVAYAAGTATVIVLNKWDQIDAEKRKDVLGRIYRQSQQMINILNELLDFTGG